MIQNTLTPHWLVTQEKVDHVVRRIVELCAPHKIILFGSYVRGQIGFNSDLDILVITNHLLAKPHQESVRLRRALHDADMPMDILVVSEDRFERLRNVPGLIYGEVANTGKVVYEAKQCPQR